MTKFNTNQNRQFYVATAVKTVDASHSAVETLTSGRHGGSSNS